jgi:hypothetical protein
MTLRDVHAASMKLAQGFQEKRFILPPSRLHDLETKNIVPNIHRLYTLAEVYEFDLRELLEWYGVPRT